MIIKSIPVKGKAFHQLLHYMCSSKDRLCDEHGQSFMLKRNLRGQSIEALIKEFHMNEDFREVSRSSSNHIYHEVISFADSDTPNITTEILKDLTEEYVALRAPNALVVATAHHDQDHRHVHLMISGIQYRSGIANRITKKDFGTIKQKLQTIQQERYPQLKNSIVEHGKKARQANEKVPVLKTETHRDHLSHELKRLREECMSPEEFLNRLQDLGMEPYARGGTLTGITYDGKNYRFKSLGFDEKFDSSGPEPPNQEEEREIATQKDATESEQSTSSPLVLTEEVSAHDEAELNDRLQELRSLRQLGTSRGMERGLSDRGRRG